MNTFGLIAEGITDQIVIENILVGYFNNPDIDVNFLQPLRDETGSDRAENYGGWSQVIDYCQSRKFRNAFRFNQYIIIQIDTDVSQDWNAPYTVSHRDENGELTPEKLIEKVIEMLVGLIEEDFYQQHQERIIFAISVHSIECWFLPLYYSDNKKAKITGCLESLNRELAKKEKFTIDANAKKPKYYRTISKKYIKQKILMKHYSDNPSLKTFIQFLDSKNIIIED
jgi:hypothetical protein